GLGTLNSQRLPRNAVVWSRTVTRSSSSSAGLPVNKRAGRTLAAIPKSISQTSPLFTAGIFLLHAVEHYCAFERRLIATLNVFIVRGEFRQLFAHRPPFGLGQFRQFIDDISRAHLRNLRALCVIFRL